MRLKGEVFSMLDWILTHPEAAGVVAGAVVTLLIVLAATLRVTGSLRQGLLALMLQAEKMRRKGQLGEVIDGPKVMDFVIQWAMATLVPRLPAFVRPLITPERLRAIAQRLYDLSLDYLDDGIINGSRPQQAG